MSRPAAVFLFLLIIIICESHTPAFSQVYSWRKRLSSVATTVGINPLNPATVYAEGEFGTFYVSHNKGVSWVQRTSPGFGQIRQILVHPYDTNTIFCATFSASMKRSTDNGSTWQTVIPGYGIDGESITYDPVHPDTMYAGNFSDGAVYRSTNRGLSWVLEGTSHSVMCALAVRPDSGNILYAGTGGGTISKSSDFGATWRVVKTGQGGSQEIPRIVVSAVDPMTAYATVNAGTNNLGVWKTTDGGEHWYQTALDYLSTWSMVVDSHDQNTVYAGTFVDAPSTVFKTTDGGLNWSSLADGMPEGGYQWSLKIHPVDPSMLWASVTNDVFGFGGIYRWSFSTTTVQGQVLDAETNIPISNGSIKIPAMGDSANLAVTGGSFLFRYYDGDPSLTPMVHVNAYPYYPHDEQLTFVLDSIRLQNIKLQKLPKASIHGTVIDSLTGIPVAAKVELTIVTPSDSLVLSDSTDTYGAFHFDSLYVSYSGVVSYARMTIEPNDLPFANITVTQLNLDTNGLNLSFNPRADIFVVGEDSASYMNYYVSALQSLGLKSYVWNMITRGPAPLSKTNQFLKNVLIYFTGSKHTPLAQGQADSLDAYVAGGGNLFITGQDILEMNDTAHFFHTTLGLTYGGYPGGFGIVVKGLGTAELFSSMGFLIVGQGGAYNQSSPDIISVLNPNARLVFAYGGSGTGGIAGVRIVDSVSGSKVIFFGYGFEAINPSSNRKNVMQKVIGYFDGSIILGVDDDFTTGGPESFHLDQNYPNPFNPSTVIRFALPHSGTVSLKVYNLLGQEVSVIINNQKMTAGVKEVLFNANGLSTGIYYYRLIASNFGTGQVNQQVRKMQLVK